MIGGLSREGESTGTASPHQTWPEARLVSPKPGQGWAQLLAGRCGPEASMLATRLIPGKSSEHPGLPFMVKFDLLHPKFQGHCGIKRDA